MKVCRPWLKRIAALLLGVAFLHWLVVPTCPCQWRAMFASAEEIAAEIEAGPCGIAGVSDHERQISAPHGPHELCVCSEDGATPLQAAVPEVPVPAAPVSLATTAMMPTVPRLAATGASRFGSGTDPPGGGMRRHLCLRILLI